MFSSSRPSLLLLLWGSCSSISWTDESVLWLSLGLLSWASFVLFSITCTEEPIPWFWWSSFTLFSVEPTLSLFLSWSSMALLSISWTEEPKPWLSFLCSSFTMVSSLLLVEALGSFLSSTLLGGPNNFLYLSWSNVWSGSSTWTP